MKSTDCFLSSVTVMPAMPKSALPEVTAVMIASKSISSITSLQPSLSQTAFAISAVLYCATALVIGRIGSLIDRKVRILR